MKRCLAVLLGVFLVGCTREQVPVSVIAEEFVFQALSFSPISSTAAGYHSHVGVNLDEQFDDVSEASIAKQRAYYKSVDQRLKELKLDKLNAQDRADCDILANQVGLALLEFDVIQSYKHNPTTYVELAGTAFFTPYSLEYAAPVQRYRHIIARLEKLPKFLADARKNLVDSPEIWNRVAREENEGTIALIDKTLRGSCPETLREDFDKASKPALAALREFDDFLANQLSKKTSDWRLGAPRYANKFRFVLGTTQEPAAVLAEAERMLTEVRKQMFEVALPLHKIYFPAHRDPVDLNLIVGETLGKIAEKHSTPDKYFDQAKRDLEETRKFVQDAHLVPLPARANLQVIPTPEFMRGIYSVGGFNPAPPLEPQLGAYYWLTPIPKSWPKERVDSKLREYNDYGLKLLTIHEAMPGHYVQAEYANDVDSRFRRLLRNQWGNGAYVEGWAVYVTEAMLDAGYLESSSELRLTFLKQQLRMIANTILDIRMQTMNMTDDEAMDLMLNRTFQEKEEAQGKLQRAKLSSCQLPTYFVGWRDWRRLAALVKKERGAQFKLPAFHEEALKQSAVPVSSLARILVNKPLE